MTHEVTFLYDVDGQRKRTARFTASDEASPAAVNTALDVAFQSMREDILERFAMLS